MLKTVTNTKNCQLGNFFEFFVVYKNVWLKFLRPILRKLEIAFISDVFQNFQPFSKKSCLKLLGYDFLFLYHNHSTVHYSSLSWSVKLTFVYCSRVYIPKSQRDSISLTKVSNRSTLLPNQLTQKSEEQSILKFRPVFHEHYFFEMKQVLK